MPLAVTEEETRRTIHEEGTANAKRLRLDAAVKALAACGLAEFDPWALDSPVLLNIARGHVQALRARLADGRDPARYAATGVALEALGRLWAVS